MLYYSTFDDAWGSPISPKLVNPYRNQSVLGETETTPVPEPKRSDTDICRDVLTMTMATQGPSGIRRLMGPEMCHELDRYNRSCGRRNHEERWGTFSIIDEFMLIAFMLFVVLLLVD
jgi:hypothetical protein